MYVNDLKWLQTSQVNNVLIRLWMYVIIALVTRTKSDGNDLREI